MAYDIFISYRRNGGYETAKHLFDLLSRDGYNVSFDIDTLRNGDFDVELLKRIEECTDFILILNKGAFDRSIDPDFDPQKDWLRQELAHALKLGKNIIPIMLNGFTEFPDNLPADVARVQKKNGPKYDQYYFDGFYNKLVDVFLETAKPVKPTAQPSTPKPTMGTLRIDTDCDEQFITIENYHQKLIKVKLLDKYIKFLDKYNTRRAKERLDYLLSLLDDEFERFEEKDKFGFKLKTSGEIVIPLKYDDAWSFSEGLASVKLNGKCGYIDKTGNEVIPLKYDYADDFSEGLARVKLNGKYGFIDKTGNEVIPLKYDFSISFSEGLAMVELNGKRGYIDKTGNKVIPLKYDGAGSFSEGLAAVLLNSKIGFIDKTGNEVIPLKYDNAWDFSEGLAAVELNGKYGYIDKTGNEVIPLKYDDIEDYFSEGLAAVELNGKYGYIDKTGNEVILLKYDYAFSFIGGLAKVKLNDKWGFIDKTGNEVIPLKYDYAYSFDGGKANVELNGEEFYIDKNGNRLEE